MRSRFSFRVKLMMILLIVSLTSMVLLGLEAYQASVAFRTGKESQLKAAAEGWVDKIDRNLFERYGDVQAFALSEAARSGNSIRISDFINDMMTTYAPIYDLMIVTDAAGKVIAVSTKNKNGEDLSSASLLGVDFSSKAWFKKAVSEKFKAGTSIVEDLHIDEDVAKIVGTSGRVMNFTAPIRDKQSGRIVGVWSNRMSWSDVVEVITKEEAEKIKNSQIVASFPYIINSQGLYLLHPQGDEVELKKSTRSKEDSSSALIRESAIETSFYSGNVLEFTAKSKGYSTYPGNGWSASLQIPASDTQSRNNNQLIVLAFALISIANILAFAIIRRMGGDFEKVVAKMTGESAELTQAANQISTASQKLSESTIEQAAAIEETAASMEEITSMLGQTTLNAAHCKTLSDEGQTEVHKGKEVVSKMSLAMEEIAAANSKLDRLVGLIEDIKDKTKIINDIVSETRLLSFNASIEAARAGVHGKGFAVVAEEVGKLANISGKAADQIRELLDSSKLEVSQVVKDTQERVHLGKSISLECETAFGTMGKSFERVNELIRTIANASKEQETGIKQTNRAMTEMDKVTHSNSNGAQVLSEQADKLFAGAESLNQSIGKIRLIVVGDTEQELNAPVHERHRSASSVGEVVQNHFAIQPPSENSLSRSDKRWKGAS